MWWPAPLGITNRGACKVEEDSHELVANLCKAVVTHLWDWPMKALTATALLLVWGAVALAKPSPIERRVLVDADINIGWVGAMLSERR